MAPVCELISNYGDGAEGVHAGDFRARCSQGTASAAMAMGKSGPSRSIPKPIMGSGSRGYSEARKSTEMHSSPFW